MLGAMFIIPCLFATAQIIVNPEAQTVRVYQGYRFDVERERNIIEWIFPYLVYTMLMIVLYVAVYLEDPKTNNMREKYGARSKSKNRN